MDYPIEMTETQFDLSCAEFYGLCEKSYEGHLSQYLIDEV